MSQQRDSNPQAGQGRALPKKEADMFRSVIKFYETKLYKKGIKSADGILKKFPKHGETLAMKGLILNCLNKKEEAHELVKQGLMNDMRSHVCWHVYGLLYRSDRNYNEAIKAYKQALRIDRDNLQILRDLSLLQIQMRDLTGFAITRHQILNLKPNNKVHWLSFALAKHLCRDPLGCIAVIDSYLGTLDDDADEKKRGFESSELALYRYQVMMEIPNNEQEALNYLETCRDVVVDQTAWLCAKAQVLLMLRNYSSAEQTYFKLFQRGSTEDYKVHTGYMCALLQIPPEISLFALKYKGGGMDTLATIYPLSLEQSSSLLQAYSTHLSKHFPISRAIKRIPLTLMEPGSHQFATSIDAYSRKHLSKGVPSLGADLGYFLLKRRSDNYLPPYASAFELAKDPFDVKSHPLMNLFVNLADGYLRSLAANSTFPQDDNEESPSAYLWALYLRAKLHEMCGEYSQGLQLIDNALQHTPTLVDLYELKARLLKKSGDLTTAYKTLESGRELDLQDRYINNKTIKYMLRALEDGLALERVALFTKDEGNPEQHMFDMQCTWYELELARCYAAKRQWGKALKKYSAIEKHFEDFHEDQFDFHSYCIRKVTLRSYVNVLRFEDELWGHKIYQQAAGGLIRIYLHLSDHPEEAKGGDASDVDYSSLTAAQKKKARKKKKQEEAKRNVDNSKETATATKKKNSVDVDPKGEEYLNLDPLEQATKYSNSLVTHAPTSLQSWLLRYDVSIRRQKVPMALQALFKAKALDPNNPEVFSRIVDFSFRSLESKKKCNGHCEEDSLSPVMPPLVAQVVDLQTKNLLQHSCLNDFVQSYYEKTKEDGTLNWRIAVGNALAILKSPDPFLLLTSCNLDECRGVSIETCRQATELITRRSHDLSALKKWKEKTIQRFPLCEEFRKEC